MKHIRKFNKFQEVNEGWKSNILSSLFLLSSLVLSPSKASASNNPTQIEYKLKSNIEELGQIISGNQKIDILSERVSNMSIDEIRNNKFEIISDIREIASDLGFEDVVYAIDSNKLISQDSWEEDEAMGKMNEIILDLKSIPDIQKGEISYLVSLLIVVVLVAFGAFTKNFPRDPRRR